MLGSRWRVGRISDWVEGDGQLSSLISVRAELGRGDLRALYLGWLLCAQSGDLGRKADAKAFEIAVKTLTDEAAGRALLDAGSVLAANREVIARSLLACGSLRIQSIELGPPW